MLIGSVGVMVLSQVNQGNESSPTKGLQPRVAVLLGAGAPGIAHVPYITWQGASS